MFKLGDVVRFKVPVDTGYAFAPEGYETTVLEASSRFEDEPVMVEMPANVKGHPLVRQYVRAETLAVVAEAG